MAVTARSIDIGDDHRELLRRLLRHEASTESEQVLSIYVNLDPGEFATAPARQSQITSLLDQAAREATDPAAWRATIDALRERFEAAEYEIRDARGLAVFCTADQSLMEMIRLPRPVVPCVEFGPSAHIRSMVEVLPRGAWCVLLINSRIARVLRGDRDRFTEVATYEHELLAGEERTGGTTAQTAWERAIEHEQRRHVEHVLDELRQRFEDAPFGRLVIAAPEQLRSIIDGAMHPYVREHFHDWIDADIDYVTPARVAELMDPVIEQATIDEQERLFAQLRQFAGKRGAAALGAPDVLRALDAESVETMLIAEGFHHGGSLCTTCGHIDAEQWHAPCPVDGGAMYPHRDIVEAAIERAVMSSARLMTIGRDAAEATLDAPDAALDGSGRPRELYNELMQLGGIAAILRYAPEPSE